MSAIQDKTAPASMDFQIYNSVLGLLQFPKQMPRILISTSTLNVGCGKDSGNPVLMNDCGMPGSSAGGANIEALVEQSMPQLGRSTWNDLMRQCSTSIKLEDSFQSSWPHGVSDFGAALPDAWKSPDGVLFFSRVGFDNDKKQAVVYVLFFSYMQHVPTSGNFFLFQSKAGKWEPAGRVTYMETQ